MYKLLLSIIFFSSLFASNPKPYAALGDVIYNDISSVDSLKSVISDSYKEEITLYVEDVKKIKKIGFSIEEGNSKMDKREYLNKLRELSKLHDKFVRIAYASFNSSIKQKNYSLFSQIINNPLINAKKNEEEIMDFYHKHREFIDADSGFIHGVLEKESRIKAEKRAKHKKYKTKKMLEEEKIKRIRENDKLEKQKKEKLLEAELLRKKLEIREQQKRELAQ